MRILSVVARNFRSYETIDWSIPSTGLFLIDGENLETGRSNMVGKTTLCDSIFWCLYGYLPKWGGPKGGPVDAVIKRGQKSCRVEVIVEHAGRSYRIERSRPGGLKIWTPGIHSQESLDSFQAFEHGVCATNQLHGKTSDLDDRIPELIGMDDKQFLLAVYISQDRNKSFFSMGDAERAAHLSIIAGLESLNLALERVKEEKKAIESELERANGSLKVLHEQSVSLHTERDELVSRTAILFEAVAKESGDFIDLKGRLDQDERDDRTEHDSVVRGAQENLSESLKILNNEYTDLMGQKMTLQAGLSQRPKIDAATSQLLSELTAEVDAVQSSNFVREKVVRENARIQDSLDREIRAVENLQKGASCGTCKQPLPSEGIDSEIESHLRRADSLSAQLKEVLEERDLAAIMKRQREASEVYHRTEAELNARPNEIRGEIRLIEQTALIVKQKASTLDSQSKAEIEKAGRVLRDSKRRNDDALRVLENQIRLKQTQLEAAENSLSSFDKRAAKIHADAGANKIRVRDLLVEIDELMDLIDLFGPKGIRQIYFDGLIERIGSRAGQLFSLMTDGIYSTRIDQLGETAKGEQRLILKPVITKGGLEVPEDDLSGGARRMAMLAYDVAVSEAIGECNVFFLDEALDGLDAQGKAEAVRLLEEVARTRAVFMIDHTSEIKSSVQAIIKVTYKNETSQIERG